MRNFRTAAVAAATAATVSVSGVVAAPAFAADAPAKDENGTTEDNNKNESEGNEDEGKDKEDEGKDKEDKSFGAKLKANSSDDNGDWDPKAITAWISVFTAVLGLVGSVVTFAQKNFKLPF
mgnify:CR=1 FL=1